MKSFLKTESLLYVILLTTGAYCQSEGTHAVDLRSGNTITLDSTSIDGTSAERRIDANIVEGSSHSSSDIGIIDGSSSMTDPSSSSRMDTSQTIGAPPDSSSGSRMDTSQTIGAPPETASETRGAVFTTHGGTATATRTSAAAGPSGTFVSTSRGGAAGTFVSDPRGGAVMPPGTFFPGPPPPFFGRPFRGPPFMSVPPGGGRILGPGERRTLRTTEGSSGGGTTSAGGTMPSGAGAAPPPSFFPGPPVFFPGPPRGSPVGSTASSGGPPGGFVPGGDFRRRFTSFSTAGPSGSFLPAGSASGGATTIGGATDAGASSSSSFTAGDNTIAATQSTDVTGTFTGAEGTAPSPGSGPEVVATTGGSASFPPEGATGRFVSGGTPGAPGGVPGSGFEAFGGGPTFTGAPTFAPGGPTFTGAPTFAPGGPTFTGAPTFAPGGSTSTGAPTFTPPSFSGFDSGFGRPLLPPRGFGPFPVPRFGRPVYPPFGFGPPSFGGVRPFGGPGFRFGGPGFRFGGPPGFRFGGPPGFGFGGPPGFRFGAPRPFL